MPILNKEFCILIIKDVFSFLFSGRQQRAYLSRAPHIKVVRQS